MKKSLKTVLITAFSALALLGCGNNTSDSGNGNNDSADDTTSEQSDISIVTTFYPMYYFTKGIVGDDADVSMLISGGTEPHDYEPSAKAVAGITDADAFVYNSEYMETWVPSIVDGLDTEKTTVIEATKDIDLMEGSEEDDHDHEGEGHEDEDHDDVEHEEGHDHEHEFDPHVWLDPVLAQQEVKTITEALVAKYPEYKEAWEKNSDELVGKLEDLNQKFETELKDAKNRTFVTQHAAFGYLSKRYDLIQQPIAGLSPEEEPSPKRVAELKEFVDENQISVIYFEENATSAVSETLAKETGAKTEVLSPLEGISDDDLAKGVDYITVMEQNLENLKLTIK